MKIRRSIYWLVAVVGVFIILLFWLRKTPPQTEISSAPPPAVKAVPPAHGAAHTNQLNQIANSGTASNTIPKLGGKWERALGMLSTYNDVPIDFYGRLEDQFGNPVTGAAVKGNIMINNGKRDSTDHFSTTSDANGLFEFHGTGERLGIVPSKEGYALASTNTGGIYSQMWPEDQRAQHSDPNNPTVLKMWKLQGAEPLLPISQKYKLKYSATPICFDLLSDTVGSTGGDMKITVNRPDGEISAEHRQPWGITVEIVQGGLIQTSSAASRLTFFAPEAGYESQQTFGNNNGPDLAEYTFFIKSRAGQMYTKVHMLFGINRTPEGDIDVDFEGVANTNGSRNWEGDPNKMAVMAQ